MQAKRPRRFSPHARKALVRTGVVVVVMVVMSYVLSHNLLGPFSVLLKVEQSTPLDQLTRAVHRWGAPRAAQGFPLVVLVDLDRQAVNRLSPQGYVFHRGSMAKVVQKVLEYRPNAVFVDFDLTQPSNENGVRSAGDAQLLEVLQQAQFPLLLPDKTVIGEPLSQVSANLHSVDARVLYDGDGQARWIPKPEANQPLPTALGLYCLGLGLDLQDQAACRQLAGSSAGDGKRIVFREIRRFASGSEGSQLWPGLVVIGGLDLLGGGLVKSPQTEGAIFLIGRTFPSDSDAHFTPIGPIQGIDIHANALMTLATYRHFSETLGLGPLLLLIAGLVFLALWLTYSITDGWLGASRFQDFIRGLIEAAIAAWFLFFTGVFIVQYYGYFLDYLFPIAAFHLALLGMKLFKKGGKNVPAEEAAH